jgi:hypothetical protein
VLRGSDGDVAMQSSNRRSLWHLDRHEVTHAVGHPSRRRTLPFVDSVIFEGYVPGRGVDGARGGHLSVLRTAPGASR